MKRNKFNLSHYRLLSMDMGELVPVGLTEVLPGDTIQQATSVLLRCSPLLSPVMHPVHVRIHHWYVPHRLVWDDFEDFITGGPDGADDTELPTMSPPGDLINTGSLQDYMGIPTGNHSVDYSAIPFRGYNLIWNEWYRDQDLETELTIDTTSGPDTTTTVALQNCPWEKDYFTSARPWEQKGPSITIPIGDTAPVLGIGLSGSSGAGAAGWFQSDGTSMTDPGMTAGDSIVTNAAKFRTLTTGAVNATTNRPDIVADLQNASAVTVNRLREALALQRFEEARARYGSRYTEYLRYLGIRSSDARLQRPEYLGGGRNTIQFSEVLQTAEGEQPVGEMRGHGIAAMRSNRYRRFFEEHGYVFSLLSVRPKTIYSQGMRRTFNRRTKEDFFQRELQHIGQQEVLNKEVYASDTSPDGVFGFQDRYDEYRRTESGISGEFRNSTLDFWHLSRTFASLPALNASFVKCVPSERIFAVPSQDVLYVMARHSIQARRMLSARGNSMTF